MSSPLPHQRYRLSPPQRGGAAYALGLALDHATRPARVTLSGERLTYRTKKRRGQALIVAVLIIFMAAMAIGVAAATVALAQNNITQNQKLAKQAYNLAASGLENTTMRMTRGDFSNPATLQEGAGTCTIIISGSSPSYQILAVSEIISPLWGGKKVTKKIQANVTINDGLVNVTSWQEMY